MAVKIYTTPTCFYCRQTKEFFKEKRVKFTELDVSKDEKALHEMIKKSSQMGVPVININGQIVVGFDKEKIAGLIDK